MNTNSIHNESAFIGSRNINSIVNRAIVKERGRNSRILYAGANPNLPGTMVVCKVVELFRGKYFYEETVFNPHIKSVHTTLTSTNERLHEISNAEQKLFETRYKPNPQIVAATAYSRELDSGRVFHDTIIRDLRTNQGLFSPLLNFCLYWRINRYLKTTKY